MSTDFTARESTGNRNDDPTFTPLEADLRLRLELYGSVEHHPSSSILYQAGRDRPEMFLVIDGAIDIVGYSAVGVPEVLLREVVGGIVGEMALLTAGEMAFVSARTSGPTTVRRFTGAEFRTIMRDEPELSDVLLKLFVARRKSLLTGEGSRSIEIIGDTHSRSSLALRTYAVRQGIPHRWIEADSAAGQARIEERAATGSDLPMVVSAIGDYKSTSPGELAHVLGLSYPTGARDTDLVVIGAGPAGMASAVYGASEGLETVVLDAVSVGGQAASSARIENYLGFSSGISGVHLMTQSAIQAEKFGAQIYAPCAVSKLISTSGALALELTDGTTLAPRAIIIATGARYRALHLARWEEFENSSIYYAATGMEARECAGQPVVIIGGANSAGQAALFLAHSSTNVTVVIRGNLRGKMSSYLADRLMAHPLIRVMTFSEVRALHGDTTLTGVVVTGDAGEETIDCRGLFCFVGAEPATQWLSEAAVDQDGFILTDSDLPNYDGEPWSGLGRKPLPFETSIPSVFAVGDVRHGSMKRVAAAVGEGASAVQSVHRALGAPH